MSTDLLVHILFLIDSSHWGTPCTLVERHSIFAVRQMSLAAGVRAMHAYGEAFNICHETDKSGCDSQSKACPDT